MEQGHGKRAGMLSDYTFAVRDGDRFVNIGKAYSGLTDEEIRRWARVFRKITVARYGPVRAVKPEVVLEVSFDSIQKSTRHKSGFALRFPRIVRLRPDKSPAEVADTRGGRRGLYGSRSTRSSEARAGRCRNQIRPKKGGPDLNGRGREGRYRVLISSTGAVRRIISSL